MTASSIRSALEAIRDWSADDHPEVCYDQFAYERMVASFQDAARAALAQLDKAEVKWRDPEWPNDAYSTRPHPEYPERVLVIPDPETDE